MRVAKTSTVLCVFTDRQTVSEVVNLPHPHTDPRREPDQRHRSGSSQTRQRVASFWYEET